HGISRDAFDRFTAKKPSWYYEIVAPGFKYNMTDIAASIGICQLKKVRTFQQKRERIARMYDEAFADLPVVLPPKPKGGDTHAWHLYVIRLGNDVQMTRNEFIERLFALGIGCSVHYIPLHEHPYWKLMYGLRPEMFPVSQSVYERCVSLPIYSRMTDADVERVVDAVKRSLNHA
ncbi:MAG: DegT/DnrJ/EryC1/StrS family aminotransferase, partial [Azoarcus sp.]|nr:DegT/DnrJ/EryC1/StrS family aminotransferase [Azoarcus sp.]